MEENIISRFLSIGISHHYGDIPTVSKHLPDINRLLTGCDSLESLCIDTCGSFGSVLINGLELPRQLREFSIRQDCTLLHCLQAMSLPDAWLMDKSLAGQLRSLQFHWPLPPLTHDYLNPLTGLTHLSVQLSRSNVDSLMDALAQLPHLRALELSGAEYVGRNMFVQSNKLWDEALKRIAECRPELEHLALRLPSYELLGIHSLLQFNRLVSIEVRSCRYDCRWLEVLAERGQLEYVVLEMPRLPIGVVYKVLRRCEVGNYPIMSESH